MEKKKVLIVDDEVDFLKITKINLEKTDNYEIATASDPREIIARVKAFVPDIILLDIIMPKMDGVEVCMKLNNDPLTKNIPIIIISALDTDKDRLMMYKQGVVDFLVKPIEKDELILKIEKALRDK